MKYLTYLILIISYFPMFMNKGNDIFCVFSHIFWCAEMDAYKKELEQYQHQQGTADVQEHQKHLPLVINTASSTSSSSSVNSPSSSSSSSTENDAKWWLPRAYEHKRVLRVVNSNYNLKCTQLYWHEWQSRVRSWRRLTSAHSSKRTFEVTCELAGEGKNALIGV